MIKSAYCILCSNEGGPPLFCQPWWLDAVAGEDGWDVVLVQKGGRVVGAMPFSTRRYRGFTFLGGAPLTQHLGPWIRPFQGKSANALSYEKEILSGLVSALPRHDHFSQNWHHTRSNWLPLYWRGFSQTTRYTYILQDLSDQQRLWSGLRENIRRDIRKATTRYSLTVRRDLDVRAFLSLNRMTFARQGSRLPYSEQLVERLDAAAGSRGRREIFVAVDDQDRPHAGAYIVWDRNTAYYLMGGSDPALRQSGAMSLCLWEAICFAASVSQSFDFEGSMLEPVERYFRAFGAEQRPYFKVWRTNSLLLKGLLGLRRVRRDLLDRRPRQIA